MTTIPLANFFAELIYNDKGLVPVVTQDDSTGNVLMHAWANEQALRETINTGYMHYYSRSRQCLWRKGETSGHHQKVVRLMLDCDGDTILARVEQTGCACHTGQPTCFFREITLGEPPTPPTTP
ncbi:MAG: phosphoribosyl-AMP cyclohydrolase [Gammaproteobacteria bacterium]|nr:phosphoribosyl-AMP cyclohydrolase [Gammaproteobacteria bacterium]